MYKAIIVDDEERTRKAIRSIGLWDELNTEVCGEASDGFEALELILKFNTDIVFLDMNIPGMDGITVLKKLKSLNIELNVIVISGYDDFTYTKEAIKYGAFDYILKPINRDEFNETLKSCTNKIRKTEPKQTLNKNKLTKFSIEEKIAKVLVSNNKKEALKLKETFKKNNHKSYAITWLINSQTEYFDSKSSQFYREVQSVLDNDLLLDDTNIYCIGTNLTGMVIIIFGLDSEATKHQALFEHRLYYVLKQVNKNENIQCFEYNTAFTYDIENILTEHNKITKQLIKIDLFSLFNKHYTRKPILKSKCVNWDMKKKLDVLLQQKSFSIDNLSQVVYGLNDSKIHAEWYNILSSYNPYIIYNFLVSIENTNKISIRAKETLKYINEHLFDGQPTLDNIAHHMYLDKSYLARLFKSEFNITVGEYVQKKRLEHSVSLLEGTDLPIKDIAVKSGYTNINYFTRVFKSHYNIPPNQYRRENQE